MPEVITDVPLLALTEVLFPGAYLSLRLDNPAQRDLFCACNDTGRQIAVVMTNDKTGHGKSSIPSTTGCLASIAMFIHEGDEHAPATAILYGERRVRVLSLIQQVPYLTGSVGLVEETPGSSVGRKLADASEQFEEYRRIIRHRSDTEISLANLPEDPTAASYQLAATLPVSLQIKQRWMEARSTAIRLTEETAYMRAKCETESVFLILAQSPRHQYTQTSPQALDNLLSDN